MHPERTKTRRKASVDVSSLLYGKVPAQDHEIEKAVLGTLMLESDRWDEVRQMIKTPEIFYVESHKVIYETMIEMKAKGLAIDMLSMVAGLRDAGKLELIGGPFAITQITTAITGGYHIMTHCRLLLQYYLAREVIKISAEAIAEAYDEGTDVFELMDQVDSKLTQLRQNNLRKEFRHIGFAVSDAITEIAKLRDLDVHVTGADTGFEDLNTITCGWQPSDFIILAARPSVGKTAFSLTLTKSLAKRYFQESGGNPEKMQSVGFFSLEMKDKQLVKRMLAADAEIMAFFIQNGKLNEEQFSQVMNSGKNISKLPIYIDETSAISIQEFRNKARILKKKHNCGLIVVDYLQLMTNSEKKFQREQEVSSISAQLKATAKDLDIPIIALSQLSREGDKNGSAPQLKDLRESGAIEQDADVVMFLYRPTADEVQKDASLDGCFYASLAKHRNGAANLKFLGKFNANIQKHEWLRLVDREHLTPISNWTPDYKQGQNISYPSRTEGKDDDLPF